MAGRVVDESQMPGLERGRASGRKQTLERHICAQRSCTMMKDKLYDEATAVTAEDGEVILDGPDAVDVKVTPEAAEQTADNLIDGALRARGQRRLGNVPHKPD
jgi:hypothetical protein